MEVNGYALNMSSVINTVCIADVLVDNINHWYKVAKTALYATFSRECDFNSLVHDLYYRLRRAANNAEEKAFAKSYEDAERILGQLVKMYSKSSVYAPGLEDLGAAVAANDGQDITFCGLEAFGETLDYEEALQSTSDVEVALDIHFAKDFTKKWDTMKDDEELSTEEKLKLLSELAVVYSSLTSDAERLAIVQTAKYLLDLDENTPDELKKAFYTLAAI